MPRLVPDRAGPGGQHAELHDLHRRARSLGPLAAGLIFAAWPDRRGLPSRTPSTRSLFTVALWADAAAAGAAARADAPTAGAPRRAGLAGVVDGFRYLATTPVLLLSFAVDIDRDGAGHAAGAVPGGGRTSGSAAARGRLALRAIAIGSVLAGLTSGWIGRVRRQGVALVVAVVGWGLAVAAAGLARQLWLVVAAARRGRRGRPGQRGATGRRSCRSTRRTGCAAGCRACSPPWSPAARAWATCGPARWPPAFGADGRLGRRRARRRGASRSLLARGVPGAAALHGPRRRPSGDRAADRLGSPACDKPAISAPLSGDTVDDRRRRPRGRHRRGRRRAADATGATGSTIVDGYAEDELCPGCAGQVLAPVAEPDPRRPLHASAAGATSSPLTEPARHNAIHGLVNWVPLAAASRQPPDAVTVELRPAAAARATRGRCGCAPAGASARTGCAPSTR